MSTLLLTKNGTQFQSFLNIEENSELIVELLTGKNQRELDGEIADVFITLMHIMNAFGIESAVDEYIRVNNRTKIDKIKLAAYLAQLSKEVAKCLNRQHNNIDSIRKCVGMVMLGLLKYMARNHNLDSVNQFIKQKIERTIQRNNLQDFKLDDTKRKDWDQIFLLMAFAMASGSHCVSRQVAALLVKNKRIISTGINGTPEGCQNCDDIFPSKRDPGFDRAAHHAFSSKNEIHAEMNALLFKARTGGGYDLNGATLYCTTQPCDDCLKNIVQSGVTRIVYAESYDLSNYSEYIQNAIKTKKISLEHLPLKNTSPVFRFVQDSMLKGSK
jgi:dCMP deaminase